MLPIKKKLYITIFILSILSLSANIMAAPINDPLCSSFYLPELSSDIQPPDINIIQENSNGIILDFKVENTLFSTVKEHDRRFNLLTIPQSGWTKTVGAPKLPLIRQFLEIPNETYPDYEITIIEEISCNLSLITENLPIVPVQESLLKIPGAKTPFKMSQNIYQKNGFYPKSPVKISGPFSIRGRHLVMVEYAPIQYNPSLNVVRAILRSNISINFSSVKKSMGVQKSDESPNNLKWFSKNVLNFNEKLRSAERSSAFSEGILYIVGDQFINNPTLKQYLELRKKEGHFIHSVPMSEIGMSKDHIRNYIREQYLSWTTPQLGYVVLVGDIEDIPSHFSEMAGYTHYTDHYYAAIEPNDYPLDILAPDLIVSRISVNDDSELNTYLIRAMNYLSANFPSDTSWMKKVSFLASCDESFISEGTHNHVINEYTEPNGFSGTFPAAFQAGGDKLYCSSGNLSESLIQSHLGDGRAIINFSGHGGETYWSDPYFSSAYLAHVKPQDAAPFVVSNACMTGTFAHDTDCWGEQWLSHSNGAIAFWGASCYSFWDEDDILEKNMWQGIFKDKITWFGDITRNAKLKLLANYGSSEMMRYYFEVYHLFGDATLDLFTGSPNELTVTYPETVVVGENSIQVKVFDALTPVENALIAIRGSLSTVQQTAYTNASGSAIIQFNPSPPVPEKLELTVTSHNAKRYTNTIQVIAPNSAYLTYVNHKITSDGSTLIPSTPGTHIKMPITLKNVGGKAAQKISVFLSTESPDVTISQKNPSFSDIAPGISSSSKVHVEFDIHETAKENTSIPFKLEWHTSDGATASTLFEVVVQRPKLIYISHTVDDSKGGCDKDGIPDANEPTLFSVVIKNIGNMTASDVEVDLSAPNCTVKKSVTIGSIPMGETATAHFIVTPQSSVDCPSHDHLFTAEVICDELPDSDFAYFHNILNSDLFTQTFEDDMESTEPNGWSHAAAIGIDDWAYTTSQSHSPSHSWFAAGMDGVKDAYLLVPPFEIHEKNSILSFWQKFHLEWGYDGGVIEVSIDGGNTFSDLNERIIQNGYNDFIDTDYLSPIGGREAWTGFSGWQNVQVDLAEYENQSVIIRFRLACDSSLAYDGWWIDDLSLITQADECQMAPCR